MVEIDLPEGWVKREEGECDVFTYATEESKVDLVFNDGSISMKVQLEDPHIKITTPGIDYTEINGSGRSSHVTQDGQSIVQIIDSKGEEN